MDKLQTALELLQQLDEEELAELIELIESDQVRRFLRES